MDSYAERTCRRHPFGRYTQIKRAEGIPLGDFRGEGLGIVPRISRISHGFSRMGRDITDFGRQSEEW